MSGPAGTGKGRTPEGVRVQRGRADGGPPLAAQCYYLSNWRNVSKSRGQAWPEMPVELQR
eukprot:SAG22_NODE_69_length_22779_cov_71.088139_15_plen_60_part_00